MMTNQDKSEDGTQRKACGKTSTSTQRKPEVKEVLVTVIQWG